MTYACTVAGVGRRAVRQASILGASVPVSATLIKQVAPKNQWIGYK